ncbi:MAG: O-antigen ligase family protein [Firmicutes bacterium]|nr:O-antigen ligase family protein [Bacillota bacterium]
MGLLVLGGGSLLVGRRIARDPIFLRRAFLPALVVSTVAISVYVLYQSFGLDIRRTTGLTSYTNRMGTLLMFSGILGLGYLLSLKGRLRWLAMPYGVLVAVAMLTTLSRAAWVGGLVGAVILAFRRPRQGLVLLLVALLAGGALLGSRPAWQARFLSIFNVQRNMDRLEMWDASVRIFADHPILGIGPTSFPSIAPEYIERQDWRLHATPHNFVLTVAAEMGLAGLLALAWLGARVTRALAVLGRQRDPLRWGLGAALLALVVNDLFGQGFFTSQVGAVLWLTLGLVDGHQQGPAGEASDSTLRPAAAT